MSSAPHVTANHRIDLARSAGVCLLIVAAVGGLLLPLAVVQLGSAGLVVVALAWLSIAAAIGMSTVLEHNLNARGRAMLAFMAGSAARVGLPMALVIGIVWLEHPEFPGWSGLYVVPLYFTMLIAEATAAVRRCGNSGSPSGGSASSVANLPSASAAQRG